MNLKKNDKSQVPSIVKNIDRNKGLENYKEEFKKITSFSEKLIKENSYEPLQFYGIILCYLNYYDFETFLELLDKLYLKNTDILFSILFDELIKKSLNSEDKEYYDLLKDIYSKEIKKINDINYHESFFEYILSESEIIYKSNEVLRLLLKTLIIPIKGQFILTIKRILNGKNEFNCFT